MLIIPDVRQLSRIAAGAFVIFAVCVFASCVPAAARSAVDVQLDKLEAESQIRELTVEEPRLMDLGDWEGALKLFADNGTFSGRIGTAKGKPAILAMWGKSLAKPNTAQQINRIFMMSNMLIEIRGNQATELAKWTILSRTPDSKLAITVAGHYDNRFVRENGVWKFQSIGAWRDITPDCWINGAVAPCPR